MTDKLSLRLPEGVMPSGGFTDETLFALWWNMITQSSWRVQSRLSEAYGLYLSADKLICFNQDSGTRRWFLLVDCVRRAGSIEVVTQAMAADLLKEFSGGKEVPEEYAEKVEYVLATFRKFVPWLENRFEEIVKEAIVTPLSVPFDGVVVEYKTGQDPAGEFKYETVSVRKISKGAQLSRNMVTFPVYSPWTAEAAIGPDGRYYIYDSHLTCKRSFATLEEASIAWMSAASDAEVAVLTMQQARERGFIGGRDNDIKLRKLVGMNVKKNLKEGGADEDVQELPAQ